MRRKRVVCCVPVSWPYIATECFMSCLDMKEYSFNKDYQLVFIYGRSCYIDHNREGLVDTALTLKPDYILWLDVDAIYPKDLPAIFIKHIDDGKLLISGFYVRKDNGLPSVYTFEKDMFDQRERAHLRALERNTGVIPIDATGLQGVMMHPSVFNDIERPYFYIDHKNKEGEDIRFYRMCREVGIQTWCDTSVYVPHLDLREIPIKQAKK